MLLREWNKLQVQLIRKHELDKNMSELQKVAKVISKYKTFSSATVTLEVLEDYLKEYDLI